MDIREAVAQALEDQDVRDAIKAQIDSVSEAKASQKVQELLSEQVSDLNTSCEEFKKNLKLQNEKALDEEKRKLEEAYREKLSLAENEYAEKLVSEVSRHVNEVVLKFITDHKAALMSRQNELRVNAILESLSAVCAVAGVRAEQITEGVNYLNNKQAIINDQRIKNLKNQLRLSEETAENLEKAVRDKDDELRDLRDEFDETERNYADVQTESDKKVSALEEALKEYARKVKAGRSEISDTRSEIAGVRQQLTEARSEIKRLSSALKQVKDENRSLAEENNAALKMGAISEMKQGMTLTEAKRFEQIASEIPFERTRGYFDKLEILKNELINNPKYKKLNEVTGEEADGSEYDEPTADDSEVSRWDHLI